MNLWQREIENPAPFAQLSVGVDNPLFALLRHRAGMERFCLKSEGSKPPWIPPHAPFQDRLPAVVPPTR